MGGRKGYRKKEAKGERGGRVRIYIINKLGTLGKKNCNFTLKNRVNSVKDWGENNKSQFIFMQFCFPILRVIVKVTRKLII